MTNPYASSFNSKPLSRRRKWLAVLVAICIDAIRLMSGGAFGFLDIADDFLDFLAAGALLLIVGFRWELAWGLVAELIPGIAVFPTWTALALSLPTASNALSASADQTGEQTGAVQPNIQKRRPIFVAEQ